MDSEQTERRKEYWISDAILIVLLTAVVYLFAFMYELGYANFFGIPTQFIEITIVKIIIAFCAVASLTLLILGTSSFLWMYVPKKYDRIFAVGLPVVLFFASLLVMNIDVWPLVIVYALGSIMGYRQTAFLQPRKGSKQLIYQILDKHLGETYASFVKKGIMWLPFFIVITFSAGRATAAWKKTFLVAEDLPRTVVLQKYGDILVCAPFDRKTKKIEEPFLIRRMTEISGLRFTVQSIGPLKKAVSILENRKSYDQDKKGNGRKDIGGYILLPTTTMLFFIVFFILRYVRLSKQDTILTIREKIKQSFGACWIWFLFTILFTILLTIRLLALLYR